MEQNQVQDYFADIIAHNSGMQKDGVKKLVTTLKKCGAISHDVMLRVCTKQLYDSYMKGKPNDKSVRSVMLQVCVEMEVSLSFVKKCVYYRKINL